MKKVAVSIVALFLLAGCASLRNGSVIMPDQMTPFLRYTGFQIKKPNTERWFIYPRETASYRVTVRLEPITKTYDAFFYSTLNGIPTLPKTIDEFEAIVSEEAVRIENKERLHFVSIKTSQGMRQGQWCIYYTSRILDTKPINSSDPLLIQEDGFFALHPSQEKTTVHAALSQRGLETELLTTLDPDMQYLIDGVELTDKKGELVR